MKMKNSILILISFVSLFILLIVSPISLNASQLDSAPKESKPSEIDEAPKKMSLNQINDLFGEDPYLGQTSYLQSPDGFNLRDKSN